MSIQDLTPAEQAEHSRQYLARSISDLRHLAGLMGIDAKRMSKREIVAEIVSRSGHVETAPKPQLDMSGLVIRCAPQAIITR
ncbi:MAG TPA: hypothetical protein VIV57_13080 [Anaeromyxobacter sp.]